MKRDGTKQAAQSPVANGVILLIGYGNPLRRDDGAGPVVAEKLARYWSKQGMAARVITEFQLTPEMVDEIAGDEVDTVVFVDSGVNNGVNSEINKGINNASFAFQISPIEIDTVSPTLGHHLAPATLLVYAALLYGRHPRAWLITIPGKDFGHGECFSAEVDHLIGGVDEGNEVAALAQQLLAAMNV